MTLRVDPKTIPKLVKKHGGLKAVSRATGVPYTTVNTAYKRALAEGLMDPLPRGARATRTDGHQGLPGGRRGDKRVARLPERGRVRARQARRAALPAEGEVRRYLFTCAQNETGLHREFWRNLIALKEHYAAELHVARFTYVKSGLGASGDKTEATGRGDGGGGRDMTWAAEVEPYLSDDRMEVAPGLVWCGEMNILPTADRPLSGLEAYTGRKSGIFPHVQISMEPVASGRHEGTKFNYTTGAVTLRNYIQRKAGLKGEFHHAFGALLVEVNSDGDWWCRQINADGKGAFYDLDLRVKGGAVTAGHRLEAVTWGDVHWEERDEAVHRLHWGEGGMLDQLRPKYQFMHDVNSFRARSHHRMRDPHAMFARYSERADDVRAEIVGVADFLRMTRRPWCETVVVDSNHHNHIGRWLKEQDARWDPPNAELWHALNGRCLSLIKLGAKPNYLREAIYAVSENEMKDILFLAQDESFVLCHDAGGGIECGDHGDLGPNGSRGNPRTFARMGRKRNIGHFHGPGIYKGVYVAGTSGTLTPDWTAGPSTWSNSDILTYRNGKRCIVTIWKGRYRA